MKLRYSIVYIIPCGLSVRMDPFIRKYHNEPILADKITLNHEN